MTRERLLGYAWHKVHPQVRAWLGDEAVARNLEEELQGGLERLVSDALAAEFRYHCPVAGAKPEGYKNRILSVGGLELLVGIRFLGLDMAQPFVDVLYTSEPTLTPERLAAVQNAVRADFAFFRPKRARFYCPSQGSRFSADGDKRLLVAPLEVMLARTEADACVTLRGASSLAFYPEYAAIYSGLHEERPELREVIRVESEADMQEYLEAGHLFEVFVDGVWAGVTAVYRGVNAGVGGFCVAEIVLAGAFRGRGFGPSVQRELAAGLLEGGASPDNLLFGTVGEANVFARQTARCGRARLGAALARRAQVSCAVRGEARRRSRLPASPCHLPARRP